jgi:hypothetical protein
MKRDSWNCARWMWYRAHHHARLERYINAQRPRLSCQECGGMGGDYEPILFYGPGGGPWEECGFCEGLGFVTPWIRGLWLKWKRDEKRRKVA